MFCLLCVSLFQFLYLLFFLFVFLSYLVFFYSSLSSLFRQSLSKTMWCLLLLFVGVCVAGDSSNCSSSSPPCTSSFFPCSDTVVGNLLLVLFYGAVLGVGAKFISDGAEGVVTGKQTKKQEQTSFCDENQNFVCFSWICGLSTDLSLGRCCCLSSEPCPTPP